jgi:hypothetical protein
MKLLTEFSAFSCSFSPHSSEHSLQHALVQYARSMLDPQGEIPTFTYKTTVRFKVLIFLCYFLHFAKKKMLTRSRFCLYASPLWTLLVCGSVNTFPRCFLYSPCSIKYSMSSETKYAIVLPGSCNILRSEGLDDYAVIIVAVVCVTGVMTGLWRQF